MLQGFGTRQQELLKHLLTRKEGMTIDQLAATFGISRTAVNQHISALMRGGYIESRQMPSTGGRPGRAYVLTQRGIDVFPKQYALFANLLLKAALDRFGADAARSMLTQLGTELGDQFAPRLRSTELGARVGEIAGLMQELGYEAKSPGRDDDGAPMIEALNCIYHHLALQNRTVCQLDVVLLERLSGANVAHTACMADGHAMCRFSFSPKRE